MKMREMVIIRNTLLASVVSLFVACGGSDNDSVANNPPTLDKSKIVNPIFSVDNTDDECRYLDSDLEGVTELRCDFLESTTFRSDSKAVKAGAKEIVSPDGLTIEIDLLTGIVDKDITDAFSVKDLRFVFPGVNCVGLNPVVVEREFPQCGTLETIRNILAENLSGVELQEYDLLSDAEALKLYQTRLKLRLPSFIDEYGFQQKRSSILVTPTALAPVLNAGERAEVHVQYTVTDGKDEIIRRTRLVVNGESSPPVYEGVDLSNPEGRVIFITRQFETLSDLDLLGGVVDPDIEQIKLLRELNGFALEDYELKDLRLQSLAIENFVPVSGTTGVKGAFSGAGYRVGITINGTFKLGALAFDRITERPIINVEIDTDFFQKKLKPGEFVDLVFEYDIVDSSPINTNIEGQQFVERLKRTIGVRVRAPEPGVNFNGDIVKTFGLPDPEKDIIGLGASATFSLDVDTFLPAGNVGDVLVQDIVSADEDTFGVDINRAAGTVAIDSTAFLNTEPGKTRVLTFDYIHSDTETNLKKPRKLIVNIEGADLNYLQEQDVGFESGGIIAEGAEPGDGEEGRWSIISLSATGSLAAESAPSDAPFDAGAFVMKAGTGFSRLALKSASFPQGVIGSNDRISVNLWTKRKQLDTDIRFAFILDDDETRQVQRTELPDAMTTDWEEHTFYLRASIDAFNGQSDIGFYLEKAFSDEVLFDNIRILPWRDLDFFDYQPDGTFDAGVLGKFVTNAPGQVEVNADAKFSGENGLQVDTFDQTTPTTVTLPSSDFVQGISAGSRYRFSANLRYPEQLGDDDLVVNVSLVDEASPSSKLTKTIIVDENFWTNLSTVTFNIDVLNKDNKDWSKVDVALELEFPNKDQVVYVDNIRFFQVP